MSEINYKLDEENRTIIFSNDINNELEVRLVSDLIKLDSKETKDITIYINTDGGDYYISLSIYSLMKSLKSKITTIALGSVCSDGIIIYLGGTIRKCYKTSIFLIHDLQQSCGWKTHNSLEEYVSFTTKHKKDFYNKIILENTNISKKDLEDIYLKNQDLFLDSKYAMRLGLANILIGENK